MAFSDFSEQQHAAQLLQRSLARGRLAHAYLFTGSDLAELEKMATALVKTINCVAPPQLSPEGVATDSCDRCASCLRIDRYEHPDIHFVRPESKSRVITIEQVRDLMQTIYLKPSEGRMKAAVIVAADRLNPQAANAFLKTLEEPPSNSFLVLLSTDPQRVLETIVSRCLRLNFESDPLARLNRIHGGWLREFAAMAASPQKGLFGRYRLLDLIISRLAGIKSDTEASLTERSPLQRYDDADPKLRQRWEDELAAAIEAEYRRERSDLVLSLQWWLRDVWLRTLACGAEVLAFPDLEVQTGSVAGRLAPADSLQNLETIEHAQRLLGTNVQEALALEVSFLKLRL